MFHGNGSIGTFVKIVSKNDKAINVFEMCGDSVLGDGEVQVLGGEFSAWECFEGVRFPSVTCFVDCYGGLNLLTCCLIDTLIYCIVEVD